MTENSVRFLVDHNVDAAPPDDLKHKAGDIFECTPDSAHHYISRDLAVLHTGESKPVPTPAEVRAAELAKEKAEKAEAEAEAEKEKAEKDAAKDAKKTT